MIALLASVILAAAVDPDAIAPKRDETLHLNITERRIDSGPYQASLQVGLDQPLVLRVGVELQAGHLTTLLRGVRGTVRFHGDLSRLEHLTSLSARRAP